MTDPVSDLEGAVPGGDFSLDDVRREGLLAPSGAEAVPHDGTGRVELAFTVRTGGDAPPTQRSVRVPPGVTVFDSASWNGIAIDSTCGGHGTCHKCRVRVEGPTPRLAPRRPHVHAASSSTTAGGWPAWSRRPATSPSTCRR